MKSVLKDITWNCKGKNGCVDLDVSRDAYYEVLAEVDFNSGGKVQRVRSEITCEVFYEIGRNSSEIIREVLSLIKKDSPNEINEKNTFLE